MACSAAQAVLEVMEKEKLMENATKVGDYLLAGFRELQEQFDIVGDVRGCGLFLGVELIRDGKPDSVSAYKIRYKNTQQT